MVAGEMNTHRGLAQPVSMATSPACSGRLEANSAQSLVQAPVRPPALWPRVPLSAHPGRVRPEAAGTGV